VIELAVAALAGLALGVVTGMPLGVVNVAVADAAAAGRTRFAIGIGVGGAIADAVHAALAFVGIGRVVTERPEWTRAMAIVAAMVITGYVVLALVRRRTPRPDARGPRPILVGIALTLPNPGALAAWVAVAAALWPTISLAGAFVLAAGVGVGSALWFAVLARWIARSARVARAVARVGLAFLVAIAAAGIVRELAH